MHTRTSLIRQMSNSFLHRTILKNFYNLRHTILNLGRWHNFSVFVQSYPPPRKKIIKIISSLILKEKLLCIDQLFLSRQGIFVSKRNFLKGWKPDNVTRAACSVFRFEPRNLPKVAVNHPENN
jgi:hypothetical protein